MTASSNPLFRLNAQTPFIEGIPNSFISKPWYRFLNSAQGTIFKLGDVTFAGGGAVTFNATDTSNVTLPTTGTLATLDGAETLENKTFDQSPPFAVTSSTQVPNFNASQLEGAVWASPPPIGATTPNTGEFTTLDITVTSGTPPISVISTTVCPLLNVGLLNGYTWSAPPAIGSGTPGAVSATTLLATGPFGCNGAGAQTPVASGGPLAAYAGGTNGLSTTAAMQALVNQVIAMRAALVANGIMS